MGGWVQRWVGGPGVRVCGGPHPHTLACPQPAQPTNSPAHASVAGTAVEEQQPPCPHLDGSHDGRRLLVAPRIKDGGQLLHNVHENLLLAMFNSGLQPGRQARGKGTGVGPHARASAAAGRAECRGTPPPPPTLAPVLSVSSTLLITSVGPVAPPGSRAPACAHAAGAGACAVMAAQLSSSGRPRVRPSPADASLKTPQARNKSTECVDSKSKEESPHRPAWLDHHRLHQHKLLQALGGRVLGEAVVDDLPRVG